MKNKNIRKIKYFVKVIFAFKSFRKKMNKCQGIRIELQTGCQTTDVPFANKNVVSKMLNKS